jgi:hypothetical protein
MKEYFRLVKVNTYGEQIDYIDREFKTEDEAWNYLRNIARIKNTKNWECRYLKSIPLKAGMVISRGKIIYR